jgi:hypothetical protein
MAANLNNYEDAGKCMGVLNTLHWHNTMPQLVLINTNFSSLLQETKNEHSQLKNYCRNDGEKWFHSASI